MRAQLQRLRRALRLGRAALRQPLVRATDLPVETFELRLQLARIARLRLAQLAVLCAVLVLVGIARYEQRLASFLRGETDLAGNPHFLPSHEPDPRVLSRIDFRRVHEELLPRWAMAEGSKGMLFDRDRADRAYQALRAEVGQDPNLARLLEELRLRLVARQYLTRAQRIKYLLWAWNDYLQRNGLPYWVRGNTSASNYNAFFAVKTYDLLARPIVEVAQQRYPLSLVTRIDRRNVREPYLGAASRNEHSAFVVVDRLHDFVIEHLWPLLDGARTAQPDRVARAFEDTLIFEALLRVSEPELAPLVRTAHHRRALAEAIAGINSRQACSGAAVSGLVPLHGVRDRDLELLQSIALDSVGLDCPAVTLDEAITLTLATEALRDTPQLAEAVGAAAAWLARGVAVHEIRHIADSDQTDGLVVPLSCQACPGWMGTEVRAELSAYLATLAWSGVPATALYQACRSVEDDGGAHGQALRFLLDALDLRCDRSPPPFLADRARQLERVLFQRSQPVLLDASFPSTLRLEFED